MDPHQISESLHRRPAASHRVGERKKTPAGTPLANVHAETYWYCDLPHPDGLELSLFLESVADRLAPHRSFLAQISKDGGSLELFVGWYSGSNSGQEFSWKLLKKLSALHLDLSLDVYAAQNGRSGRQAKRPAPGNRKTPDEKRS